MTSYHPITIGEDSAAPTGLLGGFDIADLVDHGGGRYTLKESYVPIPYSPIELYVAGFIPPEDVPDLWVVEEGNWIYTEEGARVRDDNGHLIFTASQVRTYTIEDIIAEHGSGFRTHRSPNGIFERR